MTATAPLDVWSNTGFFGTITGANEQAASFYYTEGSGGAGASFLNTLTRPSASWYWDRLLSISSTNAVPAMELSASNQLILTGTQSSSPGSIVIDPTAGAITVNGQRVVTNEALFSVSTAGYLGIGTTNQQAELDVEGTGNVMLDSGEVGIGANPVDEVAYSGQPPAPLFVSRPGGTGIQMMNTGANHSYSESSETIDFDDGAAHELVGQIAALDSDYPGAGLYLPGQLAIWSAQPNGMLYQPLSYIGRN